MRDQRVEVAVNELRDTFCWATITRHNRTARVACIPILRGYPYTFLFEAVVAGGPRGTVIWGLVVGGGFDVKEFTDL